MLDDDRGRVRDGERHRIRGHRRRERGRQRRGARAPVRRRESRPSRIEPSRDGGEDARRTRDRGSPISAVPRQSLATRAPGASASRPTRRGRFIATRPRAASLRAGAARWSTTVSGFGVKSSPGLMNRSLLEAVLLVVELPVAPAAGEQLLVRAALDDLAVLEHQDLIRAANRRQPMRDDERGAAPAQRLAGRPESAPRSRCRGSTSPRRESGCVGSARIARAMATRWRWPPDSRTPRSPTIVS